ncbi:MAG TPA: outer membrane lipoprotein carrier protein LolA [Crocinitomicaceae bacterium]|nr:outer membrane lipoprotein carrier protein LolA [Crocinitomicaceae bacterium]
MKYLILLVSFTTFFTFAQDNKSQAILTKLSTKIKGLSSFYIEFNAVVTQPNGKSESEIGKGWVKGNKFSAAYGDLTILSNGLKQWTIVKEDKSVYESDASKSQDLINPKKLMTIWENDFKNAFEKEETVDGVVTSKIKLIPNNPKKTEYHTIYVFITKATNELKKGIVKMKNGTTMTYTLTKFTENPTVDDANFVYNPKKYPGYELVKD